MESVGMGAISVNFAGDRFDEPMAPDSKNFECVRSGISLPHRLVTCMHEILIPSY